MTTWNVPAALAWIATRNKELCERIDARRNATFLTIWVETDNHLPIEELKAALLKELKAGTVIAWATFGGECFADRQRGRVEPQIWGSLRMDERNRVGIIVEGQNPVNRFDVILHDIRIELAGLKKVWAAPAKKERGAPRKCGKAAEKMAADLRSGDIAEGQLRKPSKQDIPGLLERYGVSRRTFDKAAQSVLGKN
jgi:hypothetical protein